MPKFSVSNNGPRAQAIRIHGGTKTVRAGKIAEVDLPQAPDDEILSHFKALGVTFAEIKKKKVLPAPTDAKAEAEAAVKAAQEKLTAAGDDLAAKAEAETELRAAEAALAALAV